MYILKGLSMNYYNAEKSSYCKKEHCSETSAAFLLGVKKLKNVRNCYKEVGSAQNTTGYWKVWGKLISFSNGCLLRAYNPFVGGQGPTCHIHRV